MQPDLQKPHAVERPDADLIGAGLRKRPSRENHSFFDGISHGVISLFYSMKAKGSGPDQEGLDLCRRKLKDDEDRQQAYAEDDEKLGNFFAEKSHRKTS
jgi:hypothetical protein